MNPAKVDRQNVKKLTDLPNVGKACERDLKKLGIKLPVDLVHVNPVDLYEKLCHLTQSRQDPCVLDVFISITHFMQGDTAKPWWNYTEYRKHNPACQKILSLMNQYNE